MTHHARDTIFRIGFTLLEAVLALAIIGAALVAVLQVRTQLIKGAQQVRERQSIERDDEAIFRMLVAGLLSPPEVDQGIVVWHGVLHDRPFTIERTIETITNPYVDALDYEVRPALKFVQYTLSIDDRTTVFPWYE